MECHHSYEGGRSELNGGKCDGWLKAGENDEFAIGYYDSSGLDFWRRAGADWTVCDRYTLPEVITAMRPGDPVLIDDGAIEAVVELVTRGEATLRVVRTKPGGQRLGAEKGINLPDTILPLTALTPEGPCG